MYLILCSLYRDEWAWLKAMGPDIYTNNSTPANQQTFYNSLSKASEKLFKMLGT